VEAEAAEQQRSTQRRTERIHRVRYRRILLQGLGDVDDVAVTADDPRRLQAGGV
jgi:hypothetical protein